MQPPDAAARLIPFITENQELRVIKDKKTACGGVLGGLALMIMTI